MNEQRLLKFLTEWRTRLVAKQVLHRSDEEFGQLLTLNTVIYFIESDEKSDLPRSGVTIFGPTSLAFVDAVATNGCKASTETRKP